ncbi:MAG: TetR family transcriptional regulator, partial [Pseudonocardia sp.]|nr:TetR family transcriptional regulator [Pseudonocardia sp.]
IAEVAERAHVGKGTVYLYWTTKEDLFLTLAVHSIAAVLDDVTAAVAADPELVRPHRLVPHLVRAALRSRLARAMQTRDTDLLGVLADTPRVEAIIRTHGLPGLLRALLPLWRRHELIHDGDSDRQAFALQVLVLGFLEMLVRRELVPALDTTAQDESIGAAVSALLGERTGSPAVIEAAAREATEIMRTSCHALLTLGSPAEG